MLLTSGVASMAGDIACINPATMAAPGGHYSHAVVAGGLVFISGQLPIKPDGTRLIDASFEEQARQVLENVACGLTAAGTRLRRIGIPRTFG